MVASRSDRSASTWAFATLGDPYTAVCILARQYAKEPEAANGVCAGLQAARVSGARTGSVQKARLTGSLEREVSVHEGKGPTPPQVLMLLRLVDRLWPPGA